MNVPQITSLQNPRIKGAIKLRDRRSRTRQDRIIIDGVREIQRALATGLNSVEAYVCEALCHSDMAQETTGTLRALRADIVPVSEAVFEKLAFGNRTEGIVVTAATPRRSLDEISLGPSPLVIVIEAIEKPGNVGAVIRTADAIGADAVLLAEPIVDLFNPNVIRSSLGAVFTTSVCATDNRRCLDWLRSHEMSVFAARVDAPRDYTDVSFAGATALVLGSESQGLTPTWTSSDIAGIQLPMHGIVDSLNVSTTAAVLMYEALRQRQSRFNSN